MMISETVKNNREMIENILGIYEIFLRYSSLTLFNYYYVLQCFIIYFYIIYIIYMYM